MEQILKHSEILESPIVIDFYDAANSLLKITNEVLDLKEVGWTSGTCYTHSLERDHIIHLDERQHIFVWEQKNDDDNIPFAIEITFYEGMTSEELDLDNTSSTVTTTIISSEVEHPEGFTTLDSKYTVRNSEDKIKFSRGVELRPDATKEIADYFRHYAIVINSYKNLLIETSSSD